MMLPIVKKLSSFPLFAAIFALLMTGCGDSSATGPDENEAQLEIRTAENIPANPQDSGGGPPGAPTNFTYYSLADGEIVADSDSASTEWDIAFSRTTIYTNSGASGPGDGGAVVLDQSFDATPVAPSTGYAIDTTATNLAIPTGSDNGWYNYNRTTHLVTAIEGKTIVIRTADGEHYAKLKILSYYKDNPDLSSDEFANNPDNYPSGYYTFKYAIQTDGSHDLK